MINPNVRIAVQFSSKVSEIDEHLPTAVPSLDHYNEMQRQASFLLEDRHDILSLDTVICVAFNDSLCLDTEDLRAVLHDTGRTPLDLHRKLVSLYFVDQERLVELLHAAYERARGAATKFNILRGDTQEFSHELAEIEQLEAFVGYQREGTDATQFILDWSHHQRLRNELHAFPFARDTCDVHADIRIAGGVQVQVEGAVPMQSIGENQGSKTLLIDKQRYTRAAASRVAPSIFDIPTTPTKVRKPTDFLE